MDKCTLEQVLADDNIQEAIDYVNKKKKQGADIRQTLPLAEYWMLNKDTILELIRNGKYEPDLTRQYEELSKKGKKRCVSSMKPIDKMLCRALLQIISPYVENLLSPRCFSYRKGMGTQDIVGFATDLIENKNEWVAEIDVQDYFDCISHDILLKNIHTIFSDEKLICFIASFIECKVESEAGIFLLTKGILQGMPLSPLLSNIFLMDFDKCLENKFEGYCRYGDDIRIYLSTKEEAQSAKNFVIGLLVQKRLIVNKNKSGVFEAIKRPHFGFELTEKNGHIIAQSRITNKKEVYHVWQKTSLKELDHNYHIVNNGILTKKDFTILFENEDEKKFIPVEVIDSLNIYANVIFSSNFFQIANQEGFSVNFMDQSGNIIGRFIPTNWKRNVKAEMAQVNLLNNEIERLKFAKKFQQANIFNIRASLRYYERREHDELIKSTIDYISEILEKVKKSKSMDSLMIYEAQARQKYFQCFNTIMSEDDFEFTKRTRQPPEDALNAMISFGNTLLYNRFANEIYRSQLDIRFGILHSSLKNRESLNLDLADLFKPILVDRTIFTLVNKKMIHEVQDFQERENGGVYMNVRGKRIFIREFERKLYQKVNIDGSQKTYADLISLEVKKLQGFFLNNSGYKPFKYVN